MRLHHIVLALALSCLAVSCGKEDSSSTAMPTRVAGQAATEATNENAASLDSVTTRSAPESDIPAGVESSTKALSGKDYVGASVALLKVDTKELDERTGPAYRAAKIKLQRSVAEAAASGDPRAAEAIELLRAAAQH